MTVEERYSRASRSSHLETRRTDESPGDLDTVIAAGMAESMGILLTRLRGEWDAAAGEVAAHARNAKRLDDARAALVAESKQPGAKPFDAAAFDKAAASELLTGRALILMNLRSLGPAKQAVYNLACRQAPFKACHSEPEALAKLVGQVLDVWLDKLCHHCEGRGFSGGYGSPRLICGKCGGTGARRHAKLGATPAEHAFGLWLLNVADSRCSAAMKQIQRKTRQV